MTLSIGIGYDIHRFQEGRPLKLGGVQVPWPRGLAGHSDADVLLHAIMDALLGAAGLGDLGQHFPPHDPAYAGADSLELLRRVREMVQGAGMAPVSVDATVIAQEPPLAAYLPAMRRTIADALGLEEQRVNVKAKSHEGLGALGRSEGVAALAVALLSRDTP
ncbi:MAG: 2-C-methyl-D-erythritol 2,4-cyclodiphosphate synthase [Dehalococcoidia bacterium]|jgi:2-C-methyl-D-erythritol 2,4-cyclodiphosphate synthase|nr:2-C-methyl-D-erythritol 2,4-cyclodiphosphate synthase [Dehalococcoidia bacterium]MDW8009357.1 2-C-methyl-D-erythritol 2,4-cyclodiphosphate synthase [Chloroflexota bacterium]